MSQNGPPVFRGVWRNFDLQGYQSLVLTLTSNQALALLAFVGALLAYTQTRLWIISRYLLIRILRPVQLTDDEDTSSLWRLSQVKAIRSLVTRDRRQTGNSMTTISPWFGIASLFNML